MPVRLNITVDEELYRRLKKELPPRGISAFIGEAVKDKLRPGQKALDTAYQAASRERWRIELAKEWAASEGEAWPD